MFAVFAMISAVSAVSAVFRQSSAKGDGEGENDRKECFHATKVFVADRSCAFTRWSSRLRHEPPLQVPETRSTFHPRAQKTLPVAAMCIGNPDCSAVTIQR
jgi:hypothetical protein